MPHSKETNLTPVLRARWLAYHQMQEKGKEGWHGTWDESVGFTETVRVSPVQPKGEVLLSDIATGVR